MNVDSEISGGVIWVVIAIVVGLFKLAQGAIRAVKRQMDPERPLDSQRSSRESMRGADDAAARTLESEEERTRKFLEALGLPPPEAPARPVSPAVLRPQAARVGRPARELPVPPFIAPSVQGRRRSEATRRREELHPPALPGEYRRSAVETMRPSPPAVAPQPPLPGESAIERIHFAELRTPEVAAFHTRSSEVSALPFEIGATDRDVRSSVSNVGLSSDLLQLVRSPEGLRAAMLLREILGPPRGLQSFAASSSLSPP